MKDILTVLCSVVMAASFREDGWPYICLFGVLWFAGSVMGGDRMGSVKWPGILRFPFVHLALVVMGFCLIGFAMVSRKMFTAYVLIFLVGFLISKLKKGREERKFPGIGVCKN